MPDVNRDKEVRKNILGGEYPHGITHVPGGDEIPGGGGGGLTVEQVQGMIDATVADLVTKIVFDAHTHDYRKITELGVDGVGSYGSPVRVAIVDDSEVNVTDANKVAAAGITVATEATEVPN